MADVDKYDSSFFADNKSVNKGITCEEAEELECYHKELTDIIQAESKPNFTNI